MATDTPPPEHFDVLIVGAGLSGIDAAYRLQTECAGKRYAILEARDAIGGTWDLFRYPGIRSDSDMYTLGFPFRPWPSDRAIAGGEAIRDYIADTAREFGIDAHIRFGTRVVRAAWSSADATWTVEIERDGAASRITCAFLYMASGYYDYAAGFTPAFKGVEDFAGDIVHPQHWPEQLDWTGKRVVVIGSGATAVTLVPSLADRAAHVTMLQRSPTYIVSRPSRDGFASVAHRVLPRKLAGTAAKWKSVGLGIATYAYARKRPDRMKALILKGVRAQLPDNYEIERDFEPRYAPWDQRICLIPDADLFGAMRAGKAAIVTDRIDRFTASGIALESGRELAADIVVTATGLVMRLMGGIELTVDGTVVNPADRLIYKGMMLSDVPNLALAFGYTNASWTLKCDLSARYACRLIRHMDAHGYASCTPRRDDPSVTPEPMLGFTSGYVQRANAILPHQGSKAPWRVHQNYALDLAALKFGKLEDGVMHFAERNGTVPGPSPAATATPAPRSSLPIGTVAAAAAVATVAGLALFAKLTERRIERMVPVDGRFVDVDGRRMHYLERGEGPTILMIHGLAGQMRNFSYALLDRLAADHRVILIDRPGSGYSVAGEAANVRAQAAQIARFAQTLGLERPLVVGHSLGGAVALALALDHPAAVGGLALIAPLTQPVDTVPGAFERLAIASPLARKAVAWTLATPAAMLAGQKGAEAAFAPEPVPADFATRGGGALVARPGNFQAAAADLVAANDDLPGMVARYGELRLPVAILYGREDRVLDPELHGRRLAEALPAAALTLIDGGHMIPVTRPDETADWVRMQATRSPR
ncbi:alpha/beta fold hydrolase [Sphingomonas rubra]|uniref:Predicted flavoprotein CzcO associated with the cation diffusion facilitator CzcD n=1 Tax=Sphingomonas rubra TaxID=634430 RepID=A0A1I5RNJ9_9SPHN|nr:Predicted flavoprotein CzcO associated with the cation diffusion facilitator CzcD [Sphingomonas rubra]